MNLKSDSFAGRTRLMAGRETDPMELECVLPVNNISTIKELVPAPMFYAFRLRIDDFTVKTDISSGDTFLYVEQISMHGDDVIKEMTSNKREKVYDRTFKWILVDLQKNDIVCKDSTGTWIDAIANNEQITKAGNYFDIVKGGYFGEVLSYFDYTTELIFTVNISEVSIMPIHEPAFTFVGDSNILQILRKNSSTILQE